MARPERLLWFHSFNRGDPQSIADVVARGPGPNPATDSTTFANEAALGLAAHVYAYLGRTLEKFGARAIVLAQDGLRGDISPFDTGGLIDRIRPISESGLDEKVDFLRSYTWESTRILDVLGCYPGDDLDGYIIGKRPCVSGPHEVFPGRTLNQPEVWAHSGNWWQAWTWEGRSRDRLDTQHCLVRWTCRPEEYADLVVAVEKTVSPVQFEKIVTMYFEGGVSVLMAHYLTVQLAA
jgi:hypothetical protein